jgi:molecular chaperone DnaK (HSP70)/outer membrane lipoprotein SlyB
MSTEAPYFGIDFGTTNSSMSWYDPETEQADIIANAEGEDKTPSIVYFGEDDEVLVGKDAEEKVKEYENSPNVEEREEVNRRVVKSIKRNLLAPAVIPIPDRDPVRPVEVVAEILKKLKRDAEEEYFYEEVDRVVITHPAMFSPQEREVLLEGAAMAGFGHIDPFEEPTAAALTVTRQKGGKIGQGLLIYDFGAGTFDLSVLVRDSEGSFYLPMKPRGVICGGDDLDMALYDYCDEIARETLGRPISLAGDVDLVFLKTCRDRKHNLSRSKKTKFTNFISSDNGSVRFVKDVEQTTFEGLIEERIADTVKETATLWENAREQGCEIDTLVLIGGSSRVPLVQKLLEEAVPVKPRNFAGKDYAVALGAAYRAFDLWRTDKVIEEKEAAELAEYRRGLGVCWTDRILTHTEVEWLEDLKGKKLNLDSDTAARIEREIMGQTMQEVLKEQEKVAREQYRKVLQLGWKEKELDTLKEMPASRLRMLLDNHEFFCAQDFNDCPVSAAKRKELASGLPWTMFVMSVHIALDETLSASAAAKRLRELAQEVGMDNAQASSVERKILGTTVEEFFKGRENAKLQALRDEYRKAVEKDGKSGKTITQLRVDKLGALAKRLGLESHETARIEREALGHTVAEIVADQKVLQNLARRSNIKLSEVKGTGTNGRVIRQDVERYIEANRPKLDLSKLRRGLDKHGDEFVEECVMQARSIMNSDANWEDKLGDCLDPALEAYAKGVQQEVQAEVNNLQIALTVPTFTKPKLSKQIPVGKATDTDDHGTAGAWAGGATGAAIGTVIFPGVGTVIGGWLGAMAGNAAGEEMTTETVTVDKEKSLTNVRRAAGSLRPALKEKAEMYLYKVGEAVADKQKRVRV